MVSSTSLFKSQVTGAPVQTVGRFSDDQRGTRRFGADHRATSLYSVDPKEIETVMQPCASSAKFLGGGPILLPRRESQARCRVTATSASSKAKDQAAVSSETLFPFPVRPAGKRRPAVLRRWWPSATAQSVPEWFLRGASACRDSAPKKKCPPKSSQVKSSQVKSSQVKSSQVKSSQVKSSQVKSSQVKSSQVKSSQVKSSQVKSSQVKSSQVSCPESPRLQPCSRSPHSW